MMQERKAIPVLFEDKTNCCACGACVNVCPKDAVSMKEDQCGFLYPMIDTQKCIGCGRCKKVCSYQNEKEMNHPLQTWAAVAKNQDLLMNAASGGVFSALADSILKEGGIVCGAAFEQDFTLRHVLIDQRAELSRLRGSKYTQSSTGYTFREIKKQLQGGKKVLFCGTPCQVAGLRSYLGKDYDELITIDLICHGVPSNRMFKDYLRLFEKRRKKKFKEFLFRDKGNGWGINGSARTTDNKRLRVLCTASSYLYFFLHGYIYRENCYNCKYACQNRPGDLTIGDYWGIEKEHSDCLKSGMIDESKGVSVIIANTEKGKRFIEAHRELFTLCNSTFEKAAHGNAQLNVPTKRSPQREVYLDIYRKGGWKSMEDTFRKKRGIKRYSGYVKSLIPVKLKRVLKRYMK